MTERDPLSPASLAAVPEVRTALEMIGGALTQLHISEGEHAKDARAMATTALAKLCAAVESATLAALVQQTPEAVVEEADYEARMAYRHYKPSGMQVGSPAEARVSAALRAALPVLVAPERARREQAERELEALRLAPTLPNTLRMALTAAEAEVDRMRGALEDLAASVHNNGPMGSFATEALVKARAALEAK